MNKFQLNGIDINSIADIPAGTGLGSSSSYTVGLLNALSSLKNEPCSKLELAKQAIYIEHQQLESRFLQDQY